MNEPPCERKTGAGFEEAKLLTFLDAIPARVAFINQDRRHLYANREYAETIGIPADCSPVGTSIPKTSTGPR